MRSPRVSVALLPPRSPQSRRPWRSRILGRRTWSSCSQTTSATARSWARSSGAFGIPAAAALFEGRGAHAQPRPIAAHRGVHAAGDRLPRGEPRATVLPLPRAHDAPRADLRVGALPRALAARALRRRGRGDRRLGGTGPGGAAPARARARHPRAVPLRQRALAVVRRPRGPCRAVARGQAGRRARARRTTRSTSTTPASCGPSAAGATS